MSENSNLRHRRRLLQLLLPSSVQQHFILEIERLPAVQYTQPVIRDILL